MKRPPKLPPKDEAPEAVAASIAKAKDRTRSRRHGPPIAFQRDAIGNLIRDESGALVWDWPFSDGPEAKPWSWLLLDAFGTRNINVVSVFVNYLMDIVGRAWCEDAAEWIPDDRELETLLHVISAHKPKDEAQAAMAAERAVTMLLTMRVGERVAKYPYDTKTVAAYAKLAVAGAIQTKALSEMQGKRKSSTQKITVKRENHVHYTYAPGGTGKSDDQPHGTNGVRKRQDPAEPVGECPSLPCSEPGGQVVLLPGNPGAEGMPLAWRQGRSAKG